MAKRWTEEEIQFLKDNCEGRTYIELAELMPNRTRGAIEYRCQDLGLNHAMKDGRRRNIWNKYEIEFLKDNHGIVELKDIGKHLGRDLSEVQYQITKLGINCQKIWSEEEIQILTRNVDSSNISGLESLLNFQKTPSQIYKKLSLLGLSALKTTEHKYSNLAEVFFAYKEILCGKQMKFGKSYRKEFDIILFKYYLYKNNIRLNRDYILNMRFGKVFQDAKLKNMIKSNWKSYYDFISCCFPKYKLKEYEFINLQVKDKFWHDDYNCIDNIKNGIKQLKRDNLIQEDAQILELDTNTTYKYFGRTMFAIRGIGILTHCLDILKIDYNDELFFDNTRFDSKEELSVYKFIKNELSQNIKKYKRSKMFNAKHSESYIPDFIICESDILIEYFGLYVDRDYHVIKEYKNRTHRKIEYYATLSNYNFVALYPEDLEDSFKGVREKLTSFLL